MALDPPDKEMRGVLLELLESRSDAVSTVFCAQYAQKEWHQRLGGVANGHPAVRGEMDGALAGAICFEIEGGRITRIFSVAIPYKLGHLDEEANLTR